MKCYDTCPTMLNQMSNWDMNKSKSRLYLYLQGYLNALNASYHNKYSNKQTAIKN